MKKSFFDMDVYNFHQKVQVYVYEMEVEDDPESLIDLAFGC